MMAYVNRENLIQLLAHENSNIEAGRQYYSAIYQKVMNMPTADVAEVKHGILEANLVKPWSGQVVTWKCSVCGGITTMYTEYCPHCGAKMDGGKEDV